MKTLLIVSLLMTACAAGTVQPPPLNPAEKVEAKKATSEDYQDALAYQASLDRIQEKFLREKHALEACLSDGSAPKACIKMKEEFCEIGTMVDSRSTYHHKPYCD